MSAPAKTASKAAVNLAVPVADQEPEPRRPRSPRSMSRLRACWVTQAPVGWAVIPARCTRRRAVLDHEEDVQAAQEDGVDVGEVDGEDRVGLRGAGTGARSVRTRRGAGSMPAPLRIFQTVEAAIRWPSPTSSPWMVSRPGARWPGFAGSVSPGRSPNRTCDSHRIRLSTGLMPLVRWSRSARRTGSWFLSSGSGLPAPRRW